MTLAADHWPSPPPGTDPLDSSGGVPYAELRDRRSSCPVSRTASGAWFLARYDDVLDATRDVATFRSSFREPGVVVADEEQLVSEIPEPRHGRIRRIINSAIAAHRVTRIEPWVRDLCHRLLDDVLTEPPGSPVDLLDRYVTPVPTSVIAHLLGAPPADHQRWAQWSDEVVQGTYPTRNRNERGEGLAGAHPEFVAYIDGMLAERRALGDAAPDDFVTRLARTEVEGQRLTDVEMRSQLAFLLISGNETTRHLIANLLARVSIDRSLFERLRKEPALIDVAVEESLRVDPPVHLLMRECMRDTEVRGAPIEAGAKVAFGLASANRDEAVFDDADTFRLDRSDPRAHLAFGGGPHVCPGASLARLEGRIALQVFLQRVAAVEVDPAWSFDMVPVFWANGPRSLTVRLTPTASVSPTA